jgi:HlyD family secretion protein
MSLSEPDRLLFLDDKMVCALLLIGLCCQLTRCQKNVYLFADKFMSPPKPTLDDLRIERGGKPDRPVRIWPIVISIAALVVVGLVVWWLNRPKPIAVRIVLARETGASSNSVDRTVLNASGYVTARRAATVASKVTGKVMEVLVEEGMHVKEGQILARIDDTNVKASLKLAEAQLASARAALAETKARIKEADLNLRRIAELAKNNISAQADLDHAEADAAALNARLAQQETEIIVADRTVATWQQQLDDTVVRAPYSGIVTTKNAQAGEMISPLSAGGQFTRTGICTIVDMESLEIEIDVNESYINRVQPSQPVEATLDAYSEWKIPCKVIAIIPTADRQKSTVKVRVGFVKLDPRILPEMGVKVAFRESSGPAPAAARNVLVPKTAVQQQDGRDVVLVVQKGRAERRAVTVHSTTADEAIIGAGLIAGEKIVADWPQGLTGGMSVKELTP